MAQSSPPTSVPDVSFLLKEQPTLTVRLETAPPPDPLILLHCSISPKALTAEHPPPAACVLYLLFIVEPLGWNRNATKARISVLFYSLKFSQVPRLGPGAHGRYLFCRMFVQ